MPVDAHGRTRPLPPDVTAELRELDEAVRSMITPQELADMLGIGLRTVQRRAHARTWPHHRIPGRGPAGAVRFTIEDVTAIVAMLRQDQVVVSIPAAPPPRRRTKAG